MLGWSLIGPLLLGCTILLVEFNRTKTRGPIDFLTATNAIYFLCFVVVPPALRWASAENRVPEQWLGLLIVEQDSPLFVLAGLVAWLCYLSLVFGYFSGRARVAAEPATSGVAVLLGGSALLAIGASSILLYARQIGGLTFLLETVMQFRAQGEPVYTEYAFLKTLSVLATGSSVLLFGLVAERGRYLAIARVLLALSIGCSLLVLLVNAGRLMVIQYVLIFPLYYIVRRGAISLRMVVVAAAVFLTMAILGHGLFDAFNDPSRLEQQVAAVSLDPQTIAVRLMLEFAFPWVNVAGALEWAGSAMPLRWFLDVPLAIAYLVPKRLFAVDLPPTVSMELLEIVNEPLPTDLISFGLYSAHLPGALLIAWVFGRALRVLENFMPTSSSPAWLVLRAAWIAYIGSRVMYGNPHHTLLTALPLLFATAVMWAPMWLRGGQRTCASAVHS